MMLQKLSILAIVGLLLSVALITPISALELGYNYEMTQENNVLNFSYYQHQKYYPNETSGKWELINENFFPCGSYFCTEDYYYKTEIRGDKVILWEKTPTFSNKRKNITMTITNILNIPLNKNPTLSKNGTIIYHLIRNYVDLEYKFYPRFIKEDIVIRRLPALVSKNFNISFKITGLATKFTLGKAIACDEDGEGECKIFRSVLRGNDYQVQVNWSWLTHPNTTLPVRIDPVYHLNSTNMTDDAYVRRVSSSPPDYARFTGNPNWVGRQALVNRFRASGDWNLTGVPESCEIVDAVQKMNVNTLGDAGNRNVSLVHMLLHTWEYPNNNTGNGYLYDDIGNGTLYDSLLLTSGGSVTFNYTSPAYAEMEASIAGDKIFSFGMRSTPEGGNTRANRFASKEAGVQRNRPHLNITCIIPPPAPQIIVPENTTYASTTRELNVTATAYEIDSWWFELNNNGTNVTFTPNITFEAIEGVNFLQVWVNDTFGSENTTNVTFTVTLPAETFNITIVLPENVTYDNLTRELNVTTTATINTWWFELNQNGTNVTFVPNITFLGINGSNFIQVWANTSSGLENTSSVYFTISIPANVTVEVLRWHTRGLTTVAVVMLLMLLAGLCVRFVI